MKHQLPDADELLAHSDVEKARALDWVIGHLSTVVKNDPRKREQTRARIALRQISERLVRK